MYDNKKSAGAAGKPLPAEQDNDAKASAIIIRFPSRTVKVYMVQQHSVVWDIIGGIVLGAGIAALSIMIPIMLGGY